MPALFHFEVHTPYRLFFSGKVESISLVLIDGEKGVLAHHSPFTAPVAACLLRVRDDQGRVRTAFITDGIIEVTEIKTMLLVDAAEWPEEIDVERALTVKQKAEENLKNDILTFENDSAKGKLRRAELRLQVAGLR